jgi:hypothetical protein
LSFGVIRRNATLGETAFKGYWKEENEAYSGRQKSIQSELMSVHIEHEKERLKMVVLNLNRNLFPPKLLCYSQC